MNWKKYITYPISFLLFLVITIFILNKAKIISFSLIAPILDGVSYITEKFDDFSKYIKTKSYLIEENKNLKKDMEKLKTEIINLKHLEYENKKLKEILNFKSNYPDFLIKSGKVIGYSPEKWSEFIYINLGKNDNVNKGDLVISNGHLIGIIFEVSSKNSIVMLISNKNFKIPVRTRRTRELSIYQGYNLKYGFLKYVKPEQDIREGDLVETTDIDKRYPAGIPVGIIEKISYSEGDIFKNVKVKINLNPLNLEYVIVVIGRKEKQS